MTACQGKPTADTEFVQRYISIAVELITDAFALLDSMAADVSITLTTASVTAASTAGASTTSKVTAVSVTKVTAVRTVSAEKMCADKMSTQSIKYANEDDEKRNEQNKQRWE